MAFSGGTFSRTFDCTTDRDNGVKILASKFDTELDGFATGLSTCILKDGTQTCTAAIPFAEGLTVPDNKTIVLGSNSDITIQYDESTNDSLEIAANVEGAALGIVLKADQGDDNADQHKLNIADGGVLTLGSKISGSFVNYLTHTPNATVADSTTAVAGNLTVGGDLTLGSGAVINEAELEAIDGVTAGTVAASKAVIVDSNKDIASFRNVTLTGELDAGSLDISGDADIDGTLEADAMTLNGTAITATATLDTGISNNNVPKFTSGVADDDFLRVAGTAIEGRSASEVLSDIGGQASLTFGISNTNAVKIDSGSVADDEYARFTANGLESRSNSEVLSDIAALPLAGGSMTGAVTITTADNNPQLTLKSTDADGGRGPELLLTRDSASPADGDAIGFISWTADNDAGAEHAFCGIEVLATDVSDGSEDATWSLVTQVAGTSRSRLSATPTETVFNEDSVDVDFRVESDNEANAFVVEGSSGNVGISEASPDTMLHLKDTTADDGPVIRLEGSGQNAADQLIGGVEWKNADTSGDGPNVTSAIRSYSANSSGSGGYLTFNTHDGVESGGEGSDALERMRLDKNGNVGIGTNSPGTAKLYVNGGQVVAQNDHTTTSVSGNTNTTAFPHSLSVSNGDGTSDTNLASIGFSVDTTGSVTNGAIVGHSTAAGSMNLSFYVESGNSIAERMRVFSDGDWSVSATGNLQSLESSNASTARSIFYGGNYLVIASYQETTQVLNRMGNDGMLVAFRQGGTTEGSISVSGTTVSYNGGHLSRWSQATDGNRIDGLVKGTVMTNLDQMAVWHHEAQAATLYEDGDEIPEGKKVGDEKTPAVDAYTEDNEQLNCMAVSSVEGDANVAGVFVNWDDDDKDHTADMNVAMTGDMVIRIAKDTTVARGDLLMSAGDGTAKPQDDDIVRSKTIAKVTSTTVSHTYDDGSYLVPCVLMAC